MDLVKILNLNDMIMYVSKCHYVFKKTKKVKIGLKGQLVYNLYAIKSAWPL